MPIGSAGRPDLDVSVHLGEAACLGAAFLWAFSVSLFRRPIRAHGARSVNLVKCSVASVLLGLTTLLAGQASSLAAAPGRDLSLIVLSAWIGLSLGDTALFASVARIGPHRALLLQTLAPVFTAVLAALWLGQIPRVNQTLGAAVVLLGIGLVVAGSRRDSTSEVPTEDPRQMGAGWAFGILSAAGQGAGIVFAKEGMESVPFVAASFLRMLAGSAGLVVLASFGGGLGRAFRLSGSRGIARVGAASFLGAYLAMMLMMAGVDLAPAAVAAVLLATTPVFGLFLDVWLRGERLTVMALGGTVIAVGGVVLLSVA